VTKCVREKGIGNFGGGKLTFEKRFVVHRVAFLSLNVDTRSNRNDSRTRQVEEFLSKHENAAVAVIKGSFLAGPKQTKSYKVAMKAAEFLRGTPPRQPLEPLRSLELIFFFITLKPRVE